MITNQFGVEELPDKVYFNQNEQEKVSIINREAFDYNFDDVKVNALGLYFGTFMVDGFRLSMEGSQLIGPLATKNILEINVDERDQWLIGNDFSCNDETFDKQFVILKHNNDYMGTAKIKNGIVKNYISKSRKMKKVFRAEVMNTKE